MFLFKGFQHCRFMFLNVRALFLLCFLFLSACSSNQTSDNLYSVDRVYDQVHQTAQKDTVELLRRGLSLNHDLGQRDPFVPIRQPELVVPVYVVPYTKKPSNERVGGHWKYLVIEEATWAD